MFLVDANHLMLILQAAGGLIDTRSRYETHRLCVGYVRHSAAKALKAPSIMCHFNSLSIRNHL